MYSGALFLFPFLGLFLDVALTLKANIVIVCIFSVLVIPLIAGYNYTINFLEIPILIGALGSGYAFLSDVIETLKGKLSAAIVIAVLVLLPALSFKEILSGKKTVEKVWDAGDYRIEYVRGGNFVRETYSYELRKYAFVHFLTRKVERAFADSSVVFFRDHALIFDPRNGTVTKGMPAKP